MHPRKDSQHTFSTYKKAYFLKTAFDFFAQINPKKTSETNDKALRMGGKLQTNTLTKAKSRTCKKCATKKKVSQANIDNNQTVFLPLKKS
jgi:arginyl-tRNA--protein-N-Asp/Glu arginylyltransferase